MCRFKPKLGLMVIVAAGLTNMVLDYVFIAVLGFGLKGAAIATVCGECVGGLLPLAYFGRHNKSPLKLGKTHFYADLCSFKNCFRNIPYFPYVGSSSLKTRSGK